jgi:hypothetical protein
MMADHREYGFSGVVATTPYRLSELSLTIKSVIEGKGV